MLKKNNFIKNIVLYFLVIFTTEMIYRLLNKLSLFSYDTVRIFISTLIISIFISSLFSLLSKKLNNIINYVILFVISFYIFFQYGFNEYMGIFASVSSSSQLDAVSEFITDFFLSFKFSHFLIFIPFIVSLIINFFIKEKGYSEVFSIGYKLKYTLINILIATLLILPLSGLYYLTITTSKMLDKYQSITNTELFFTSSIPSSSVKSFGIIVFGITDLINKNTNNEVLFEIEKEETESTIKDRYFNDDIWKALIEKETNKTINSINNYLISKEVTSYNDYTGIFEGKNIIIVMMESVNDVILNEELYPNFNRLLQNGILFNNNYSPRNACPTGNNEFSSLTGLHSIQNRCTANVFRTNQYPYSLYQLFKDQGYHTVGMHNYTAGYYYRKTIHKNMGADKFYLVQDLKIPYGLIYEEWASDDLFAEKAIEILEQDYLDESPFMLWMTMVTPHQPYTVPSIEGNLYLKDFKDLKYPTFFKRFLSKVKVTDDAFGTLLDGLENLGILDDTVIVTFGDHYPYGIKRNNLFEEFLGRKFDGLNKDKVPLVIYNSALDKTVNNSYTTFINILPTISNMFNLDFDPRYYMGRDLFSKEYESRAIFPDGSWINEFAQYNASNNKIEYFTDFEYTDKELQNINHGIINDMKISTLMIKYNYFNVLNKKLLKEKELLNEISDSGITSEIENNREISR